MMRPSLRRFVLTTHLATSIGWVGAVAAYLVLDVAVATSDDATTLRGAYVSMDAITRWVIVPLAFASFGTGLWIALATPWGLFRHYWVVVSLVMTTVAVGVLLIEANTVARMAALAVDPTAGDDALRGLGSTLVHSVGGLVVLLVVLVLNVYKPRGMTRYGHRKAREEAAARAAGVASASPPAKGRSGKVQ